MNEANSEIHMIYCFHIRGINWLQNTNILTEQYIAFAFGGTVGVLRGLPWWLNSKESSCNAGATGDTGSIAGSGWSPGEEHGNPLQYSSLKNPMDRGAWRAKSLGSQRIGHNRSDLRRTHAQDYITDSHRCEDGTKIITNLCDHRFKSVTSSLRPSWWSSG